MVGGYIAISGCHGIGKSTIVDMIGKKYDMIIIPETILSKPDDKFLSDNFKRQVWFYLNYKRREEIYFKDEKNFTVRESKKKIKIADRWVNDSKAYCRCLAEIEIRDLTPYEKDSMDMLFMNVTWTVPDLEIILTASDEETLNRINGRDNSKLCLNEQDMKLIKALNRYFVNYANNSDTNKVYLVDTTNLDVKETFAKVEKIVKKNILSKK